MTVGTEMIYVILKTFVIISLSILFAGYGLTRVLIPPEKIKSYGFTVVPLIGLSAITLLLYNLGYLGLSVKKSVVIVLFIFALLNFYAFIRERNQNFSLRLFHRDKYILIPVLLVFVISTIPLLSSQQYIISYNADMVTHVLVSEYLKENGIITPIVESGRADLSIVAHRLNTNYPLGFMLFQAFINSLANFEAYETFHIVTACLLALTVVSVYLFFKRLEEINNKYIVAFMMLIAFNTVPLWVHFDAFGPNMMGVSLVPVALAITLDAIKGNSKRLMIAAAILVSAVMSAYSMAVYFVYIIALLYLIANGFNLRGLRNYISVVGLSILFNVKISLYLTTRLVGLLFSITKRVYLVMLCMARQTVTISTAQPTTLPPVDNGNIWFPVTIERFFGLMPFKTNEILDYGLFDNTLMHVLALIAVIYLVTLIIYGVYRSKRRKEFMLYTVFLVGIYLTLWKIEYTYWLFKCVSLTLFIFYGILFVGFSLFMKELAERKTSLKTIAIALLIVVIVLNVYSTYILIDAKKELRYVDLESFLETMNVAASEFDNSSKIAVTTCDNFYDTWSIYFLRGHKIYTDSIYAYNINQILRKPSAGSLNLDNVDFSKVDAIIVCVNSTFKKEYDEFRSPAYMPIYKNKDFVIYAKNDAVIDHFPAEELVNVPKIFYHQSLIYTNDGNTVAKLSQGKIFAMNITRNAISINDEIFYTNVSPTKVYVGLLIYSIQNSSLTVFVNHNKSVISLNRGIHYKSFEVHVPSRIVVENNHGFILIDSIDLLRNEVGYYIPFKLLVYGQASNELPAPLNARSLNLQTLLLNDSTIMSKLNTRNISNVSISLDVYTRENASHPTNHYGYWTVHVPENTSNATIEFLLDSINRTCVAYMNEKPIEFQNYWKGNISKGSFRANIAIWKDGSLKFLLGIAEFDIVGGRVVKFKALNNGLRDKITPDISVDMLVCQRGIENFATSIDISKHWDLPLEPTFGYFGTYNQDEYKKVVHLGYCNIYVNGTKPNAGRYVCSIDVDNRSCHVYFDNFPRTILSQFDKLTDGRWYINLVIWKYNNISAAWNPLVRYTLGYFEARSGKVENLVFDRDFTIIIVDEM